MTDKNTAGIDLDRLEALTRATTPGNWFYQEDSDAYTHIVRSHAKPNMIVISAAQASKGTAEADARFIVAAKNAMPALIDLARRAEPSVTAGDERALYGFDREDLEAIADGLETGYEKGVDVGGSPLDGSEANLIESTTAAAARFIRAALASPAVPEGNKLVPLKCTPEMRAAWDRAPQSEDDDVEFHGAYRAMIEASPAVSQQAAPEAHATVTLDEALYALDLVTNKMDVPGLSGQRAYAKNVLLRAGYDANAPATQPAVSQKDGALPPLPEPFAIVDRCVFPEGAFNADQMRDYARAVSQMGGAAVGQWTINRLHDLGSVYNERGELIAQTYYRDAKAFMDAHNASTAATTASASERRTWSSDGGYSCLNCGEGLSTHEGQRYCRATAPSRDAAAAFAAAVDAEYPLPDSPHASVIQRATDNRAAMWRGINAARTILTRQGASQAPLDVDATLQATLDSIGGLLANDVPFSAVRTFAHKFAATLARAPLPETVPLDLSAMGLTKLWQQAQESATDTMPAPFQFAKLLLARAPLPAPAQAGDARDAARWRTMVQLTLDDTMVDLVEAEIAKRPKRDGLTDSELQAEMVACLTAAVDAAAMSASQDKREAK